MQVLCLSLASAQAVIRCCRRRVVAPAQASGRARVRDSSFTHDTPLLVKRCSVFSVPERAPWRVLRVHVASQR